MKKRKIQKLIIARETLRRLEDRRLQNVEGEAGPGQHTLDTFCDCFTDLCVSAGRTGCAACNS
jgi:hypothetical protein